VLNPASPLPLYHQLAELLAERIASGAVAAGARLPSESELCREHGLGRPTVRQATELLVRRGLIERRKGSGTYVRREQRRVDLFSLGGTLSSFERGGVELEARLVKRLERREVEDDSENPFAGREAFSFERVLRAASRPLLLECFYLDPEVFEGLDRHGLDDGSLSRLIEQRYHLRPTHALQSFRVVEAPSRVRRLLELEPAASLLLVKRSLFFPRAPRAVFVELYCVTSELSFTQVVAAEYPHD
jgi:GntR family transcriptional regulator